MFILTIEYRGERSSSKTTLCGFIRFPTVEVLKDACDDLLVLISEAECKLVLENRSSVVHSVSAMTSIKLEIEEIKLY